MKLLGKRRNGVQRHRWILDIETIGLGNPDTGECPAQLLAVLYDTQVSGAGLNSGVQAQVFWGVNPERKRGELTLRMEPVARALQWLLDRKESCEVCAHNGGQFDFRLAFPWLLGEKGAMGTLTTVGSRVLSADLTCDGTRIRLLDTIRLLPGKLEEIGEALDIRKGAWDHSTTERRIATPEGRDELLRYCINDCYILAKALERSEAMAARDGVDMRSTIASTVTAGIRSKLTEKTVAFCPVDVEGRNRDGETGTACQANFGGRVENFVEWQGIKNAYVYDFRSSYPAAMARAPLPWRYRATMVDCDVRDGFSVDSIVEATVWRPPYGAGAEYPVLPWRHPSSHRLYFPCGEWRGTWIGEELLYARENGTQILQIHAIHTFDPSDVMGEFARDGWEARKNAKGFDRYLHKIRLNSAYGKTVERREHDLIFVNIEDAEGYAPVDEGCEIYARQVEYDPAFRSVVTGATITARARIALHRALVCASYRGEVFYCDTDSVICEAPPEEMGHLMGDGLGQLALEHRIECGRFTAPKLYRYRDVDSGEWIARAKGYSHLSGEAGRELVDRAADGFPIQMERSVGLREAMKKGSVAYKRVRVSKVLQNRIGKRQPNGSPWSVEELLELDGA